MAVATRDILRAVRQGFGYDRLRALGDSRDVLAVMPTGWASRRSTSGGAARGGAAGDEEDEEEGEWASSWGGRR